MKFIALTIAACLAQSSLCDAGPIANLTDTKPGPVNFCYSPPEWQTAICLPDDPHKSLVDKSGELLYGYRGLGGREFTTRIGVEVDKSATWSKQELESPQVPIVRTLRKADGLEISEEAFAVTDTRPVDAPSSQRTDSNASHSSNNMRADLVLVKVKNTSTRTRVIAPQLVVDTLLPFSSNPGSRQFLLGNSEKITSSLKMVGIAGKQGFKRHLQLDPQTIPAGESATFFITHSGSASPSPEITTLKQALTSRSHAVAYWNHAPIPIGHVQVPVPGIQALFDSSIRNIWQAREIKNGHIAFQVGPTIYRGLWLVDGAFLLESAAMLGAGKEARDGVAYEMTFQQPDGSIKLMSQFSKENGIVLWTCVRHALLTQDKAWLESLWPQLERIATHIKSLRRQTLQNPTALDAGLMPAGSIDGGLGECGPEYSQAHWNLAGMKAFIQAARWLGKTQEAATWQHEYDAFLTSFQQAAKRDMARDAHGNAYLPVVMGEAGKKQLPQRAQWTFCHAVYPGQLFAQDDPIVTGNMAMLEATEMEGLVYGTGWDATGIWNYFASFYAHAWLWQGHGQKAAAILYAFGNHASPTLVWREEQSLKGEKFKKVGDMPHNWASAEFIRLTIHLLAIDRGDELHLLEGLPAAWTQPGMVTQLNGIATPFGPLTMALKVAADGKTARLHVEPLADTSCTKVVVHLTGWAQAAGKDTLELAPNQSHDETIHIKP